ncbi:MAG: hypothetical protein D6721_09415, partial [Gammaproteobacteria bacterium]
PSSRFDHGRYDEDLDGIADAADACPHTPIGLPVDATGCPHRYLALLDTLIGTRTKWSKQIDTVRPGPQGAAGQAVHAAGSTETWTRVPDWLGAAQWYRFTQGYHGIAERTRIARLRLAADQDQILLVLWPSDHGLPGWLLADGFALLSGTSAQSSDGTRWLLFARHHPAGAGWQTLDLMGDGGRGVHQYALALLSAADPGYDAAARLLQEAGRLRSVDWLKLHVVASDTGQHGAEPGYTELGYFETVWNAWDTDGVPTNWHMTLEARTSSANVPADVVKLVFVRARQGTGLLHDGPLTHVDTYPGYSIVGFFTVTKSRSGDTASVQDGTQHGGVLTLLVKQGYEDYVKLQASTQHDFEPLPGYRVVGIWEPAGNAMDSFGHHIVQGGWMSLQIRPLPAPSAIQPDPVAYDPGLRLATYYSAGVSSNLNDPDAMFALFDELRASKNRLYGVHCIAAPSRSVVPRNTNPFGAGSTDMTNVMSGRIRTDVAGTYTFAVDGSDWLALRIDGRPVVGWPYHNNTDPSLSHNGTITLSAGYHHIEFLQGNGGKGEGFELYWKRPGDTGFTPVPADVLSHGRIDRDGDGMADGDVDGDGLPDAWEYAHFGAGNLTVGPGDDSDGDGLDNATEYARGTDPMRVDTDGDGYADAVELRAGSDPLDPASRPGASSPLQIVSVPVTRVLADEAYWYALDVNRPGAVFSLVTGPAGMVLDPASGILYWSPGMADAGDHPVEIEAALPGGPAVRQRFTVHVGRRGDLNADGVIDAADLLLATRILEGRLVPFDDQLRRLDLAPLVQGEPAPDGQVDTADLLILERIVSGGLHW